ncbi:MAG TPA: hypothetical protein VGJ82_02810, partial [Thermoanaerobaculia bacterium]
MDFQTIHASSGARWTWAGDSVVLGSEDLTLTNLFRITRIGEQAIAIGRGEPSAYLSVQDNGGPLTATANAIGPSETFTLEERGGGTTVLRTAKGGYVTVGADGRIEATTLDGGDASTFRFADAVEWSAAFETPGGCCGAPGGIGIAWEKQQHKRIFHGALRALANIQNVDPWTALWQLAQRILALFPKRTDGSYSGVLYEAVIDGLEKADTLEEFGGVYPLPGIGARNIYYMHFYDPSTGNTFVDRPQNAKTECESHFTRTLYIKPENADDKTKRTIGFWFGLALHYFTDLTQPMHAANFKNYLRYDRLPGGTILLKEITHKKFEEYADKFGDFGVRPFTFAELDPSSWGADTGGILSIVHNVADCSRKLYDSSGLRAIVNKKP